MLGQIKFLLPSPSNHKHDIQGTVFTMGVTMPVISSVLQLSYDVAGVIWIMGAIKAATGARRASQVWSRVRSQALLASQAQSRPSWGSWSSLRLDLHTQTLSRSPSREWRWVWTPRMLKLYKSSSSNQTYPTLKCDMYTLRYPNSSSFRSPIKPSVGAKLINPLTLTQVIKSMDPWLVSLGQVNNVYTINRSLKP